MMKKFVLLALMVIGLILAGCSYEPPELGTLTGGVSINPIETIPG